MSHYPFDLIVLVADLDQQVTLQALLAHRANSLGIRQLRCEVRKHPGRDAGVFNEAPQVLQSLQHQFAKALSIVMAQVRRLRRRCRSRQT